MNDLYLIGNGFDLAHGLKTSYNDFLLWYLNDFFKSASGKVHYEDDLLKIDRQGFPYSLPSDFSSVKDISQKLKDLNYKLEAKHDFLEGIIANYRDYKWVDIEYEYYMTLVRLFKEIELNPQARDFVVKRLNSLNSCFDAIKKILVLYLQSIKINFNLKNKQLEEILFEYAGILKRGTIDKIDGEFHKPNEVSKDKKLFVCFNYTSTMELYLKHSFFENNLIYIHGELIGISNPIIFGYGDEMDPHYEKIENLNNNEFLKDIKSFGYFRTNNYQRVIRYVESSDFTVKILGHSCGLSDRILLNTIFEHPNCKAIKIYYYQKSETENDYFEKTQEISRHFKASMKREMRKKIVSFTKSIPMPQNPKEN